MVQTWPAASSQLFLFQRRIRLNAASYILRERKEQSQKSTEIETSDFPEPYLSMKLNVNSLMSHKPKCFHYCNGTRVLNSYILCFHGCCLHKNKTNHPLPSALTLESSTREKNACRQSKVHFVLLFDLSSSNWEWGLTSPKINSKAVTRHF